MKEVESLRSGSTNDIMERPAKLPAAGSAQMRRERRGAVSSGYENAKQNQQPIKGTSILGSMPSLHAIFFSSPSSSSSGGNSCPPPARPCEPPQRGATVSPCNSAKGTESACWTFLPVGSLEAKTRKRGGLRPKPLGADGEPTSVTAPRTENVDSLPLSQGAQLLQWPQSCRPPTFEQLLCLTTDDEKDATAAVLQTDAYSAAAPSDPSPLQATVSQSSQEEQFDDICDVAPPLADSGETIHEWQSLHVDRPDTLCGNTQNGSRGETEDLARDCLVRSCSGSRAAADAGRKGENQAVRLPSVVRRLRFHPDVVVSAGENAVLANAHQRKHQQNDQTPEKRKSSSFLSLPSARRSCSPDVKRDELAGSSPLEAAEMKEKIMSCFKKWNADIEGSTVKRGDCSSEGNSGGEGKSENLTMQHVTRTTRGFCGRTQEIFGEACNKKEQATGQAIWRTDVESKVGESFTDYGASRLCKKSLHAGRLPLPGIGSNEFFSEDCVPCEKSVKLALAAPSEEHNKSEGLQSKAAGYQTRRSRARSCSSRCLRSTAESTARRSSPVNKIVRQHMKEQLADTRQQEADEPRRKLLEELVPTDDAAHPQSGRGLKKHKEKGSESEKGTDECLDKRIDERRDEKRGTDAERQSGREGGSSGHEGGYSDQEGLNKRRAKSGKKHRRSKEDTSIRTGGRKRSSQRRSSNSTGSPAALENLLHKEGGKGEHSESPSLTIPPHPLFIPALRLSLTRKHRKDRGGAGKAVLKEQRPSGSSETLRGSRGSRRVANTCVANSQAACGVFAADSTEDEESDDDSASVRRERSLLSCLFTLPSISSPSRKQQLRRTINRYALFKLCSDDDTSSQEEESKISAPELCENEVRPEATCALPEAEARAGTQTQSKVKQQPRSTSTASLSSCSDKPPGKRKPVRLRSCAEEDVPFTSERRSLRSTHYRRNRKEKHRRSTSSSSRSDICCLRFPVRAAAAEHFSEDFSSDSSPSRSHSAAERLYSALEPVTELKKVSGDFAADIRLDKQRRRLRTATCAAPRCGEVSRFSQISPHLVEELGVPSSSEAAVAAVTKETAATQAVAARSPASEVHSWPADTDASEMDEIANRSLSRSPRVKRGSALPAGISNILSVEKAPSSLSDELLMTENVSLSQSRKNFFRQRPGKSRARKYKRSFLSCHSPTSSASSHAEELRCNYLEHAAHTVHVRNSSSTKFHSTEKRHSRHTTNSLRRAAHMLSDEDCIFPRVHRAKSHLADPVSVAVAVRCGRLTAGFSSVAEETAGASVPSNCASADSRIIAVKADADQTRKGIETAYAGDCIYQSNTARRQQRSRAGIPVSAERNSGTLWFPSKRQQQPPMHQQERGRQQLPEDSETSEEAWEDLGAPKYSTHDKAERSSAGDAGIRLAKTESITCLNRDQDAGETDPHAVQVLASQLIRDVASLSNRKHSSAQQQSTSSDAAPQGRCSVPTQEFEGLLSASESSGSSEAEIPAAFDTLWRKSFRCALQSVVQTQDRLPSGSTDPAPNFVDADEFPAASCIFSDALHTTKAGCTPRKQCEGPSGRARDETRSFSRSRKDPTSWQN